eukprot:3183828-Prymnesium_polylepis.3
MQARLERLSDFCAKRLWVVGPRQGVEIEEHVVACTHIIPRLNFDNLEQSRPARIQLLGELSGPRVVRAAVHLDRNVLLGQLEARGTLHVDVSLLPVQKQPLAHEHHRAVLEGRDARPLERRMLEQGVADVGTCRQLDLGHAPIGGPLGELLLELPRLYPLVCHDFAYHLLGEEAVHLRIGKQQRDRLVSHDRAGNLLDAVDLLKVDRHREDEDAERVVNLLGARAGGEVLDVEEDAHARADLAAALLYDLADVLTKRPRV